MRPRHLGTAAGVLLLPVLLAACDSTARQDGAAHVAGRFAAAVDAGDGATACGLLTERARESVTGATDATCAAAVLNVHEQHGSARGVSVWGDAAEVRVGTDVIFLLRVNKRWLVSAAGCTRQPSAPYKCDVDG
ncbi:MAG: hypothetical protein QOG01_3037 [Pseudonocardiales bacterium]|jgi:hypothetical protein|nr:hypothetical protein [Pseudonocardiales bacterium]